MRISDWSSDVCSSDLLTANAAECRALAKRFGILAVLRLEARLEIRPDPVLAGCYVVSGQVDAEVEQACVVSLEPVSSEERRVGKECVSTCRSRWSPDP